MKPGPVLALVMAAALATAVDPASGTRPLIQAFPLADVQVHRLSQPSNAYNRDPDAAWHSPMPCRPRLLPPPPPPPCKPHPKPTPLLFKLQLAAGSEFAANHEQNNHYLLLLDPDNLLWCFRSGRHT